MTVPTSPHPEEERDAVARTLCLADELLIEELDLSLGGVQRPHYQVADIIIAAHIAPLRAAHAAEVERLRKALQSLVNAKALAEVRSLVAGWNGEGREGGPFMRHPPRLGARIETNCGAIYGLDEALQAARAALSASGAESEEG